MPRSLFYFLSLLCHLLLVLAISRMPTDTPELITNTPVVVEPLTPNSNTVTTDKTTADSRAVSDVSPDTTPSKLNTSTTNPPINTQDIQTKPPTITSSAQGESATIAANGSDSNTSSPSPVKRSLNREAQATVKVKTVICSPQAKKFRLIGGNFNIFAKVDASGKATAISFDHVADAMMNEEIQKIAMKMTFKPALDRQGQATSGDAEFKIQHADCRG